MQAHAAPGRGFGELAATDDPKRAPLPTWEPPRSPYCVTWPPSSNYVLAEGQKGPFYAPEGRPGDSPDRGLPGEQNA